MRRGLILLCFLLALPAGAQSDMMKAAAETLSKFLHIVDSPQPKTGQDCWALIRPARFALEDFKVAYPGQLTDVVKELEGAGFTFDRGCTTLDRFGNLTLWPAATQHVLKADDTFYQLASKNAPAPASSAPAPPAASPPAETKPPGEKPTEAKAPEASPTPARSSAPPPSPQEAAGALLTKFFTLADAQRPSSQKDCLDLLRPAMQDLAAFKTNHPSAMPEMVQALERATSGYDQACRRSDKDAATSWAGARENVYLADQVLAKETGRPARAASSAAAPATGSAAAPPASPRGGDARTAEKARTVLALVQKLDSVVDLGLGKEEIQNRLIDAHAAVQEFASQPESEALPLTVASLRVAIAYYRRRMDAEDSFALASAKEALQKAREYLQSYEKTGQEQAPP